MNGEDKKAKQFIESLELKTRIRNLYNSYEEEEDGELLIPYVYNYFAYLLYNTGEKIIAKELIQKIDGKMTVYPWAYMDITTNEQLQKLS